MISHKHSSNNNIHHETTEYKITCAGLHCNNVPTYYLELALINRAGFFCDICARDLEVEGLVNSSFKMDRAIGKMDYKVQTNEEKNDDNSTTTEGVE
ncbi:MAG: hypothetical protein ABJB76_02695 [Candidatus Nitrosocosmicus sp.]